MEKIHKNNIHVFMLSCIKHACFHVFSPFGAYFFPHDIIASINVFTKLGGEISCEVVMTSPTWRIRQVVQHCHIMLYNTVWYTALGVGYFHWRVGPNPPWTQLHSVVSALARKPPHQWP